MRRSKTFCLLAILLLPGLFASPAFSANPPVRLATTTSTENSGLLKLLLLPFEQHTGYPVQVIAVGTGKALRLGREGDVDVMLVHARNAELKMVEDGFAVDRREVMYNDFVIVGPATDPAGVRGSKDAAAALAQIAVSQTIFVSRGDESGTHKKEKALWKEAGVIPTGKWYREAGQGMGKVLQMTGELEGYTLTDRGTWLAYRHNSLLQVLVEGDPRLFNPYGIMAVNPERFPDVNYPGARQLIDWVTSEEGRRIIRDFRVDGEALFTPYEASQ
jgi:tungstate transport system substrate-binding protein